MDLDEVVGEVMRESGERLLRLAYQVCHDRAMAEDLVQEALLRVYGSWRRRRPQVSSAEGYLRRAIINEYLRRRRLRSSSEVVTDVFASGRHVQESYAFEAQVLERDRLWAALGALSARQRSAVVLRYYEDLPDEEIAELLGCREATVRSLVSRALTTLRGTDLVEERQ